MIPVQSAGQAHQASSCLFCIHLFPNILGWVREGRAPSRARGRAHPVARQRPRGRRAGRGGPRGALAPLARPKGVSPRERLPHVRQGGWRDCTRRRAPSVPTFRARRAVRSHRPTTPAIATLCRAGSGGVAPIHGAKAGSHAFAAGCGGRPCGLLPGRDHPRCNLAGRMQRIRWPGLPFGVRPPRAAGWPRAILFPRAAFDASVAPSITHPTRPGRRSMPGFRPCPTAGAPSVGHDFPRGPRLTRRCGRPSPGCARRISRTRVRGRRGRSRPVPSRAATGHRLR